MCVLPSRPHGGWRLCANCAGAGSLVLLTELTPVLADGGEGEALEVGARPKVGEHGVGDELVSVGLGQVIDEVASVSKQVSE
jgi:hypothetical protein